MDCASTLFTPSPTTLNPTSSPRLAETVRNTLAVDRHIHLVLENDDNAARYLARRRLCRRCTTRSGMTIFIMPFMCWSPVRQTAITSTTRSTRFNILPMSGEGFAYQGEHSELRGDEPPRRTQPATCLRWHSFPFCRTTIRSETALSENESHRSPTWSGSKAAMAILLLAPSPPLLFMGEEFGGRYALSLFLRLRGDLAKAVTRRPSARVRTFRKFSSIPKPRARIPDPNAQRTFESFETWIGSNFGQPDHERMAQVLS